MEYKIDVDGEKFEEVSEFKHLECILDEFTGTDVAESHRKVVSGRKVVGAIRSLVKRGLYEALLVPVLLYGI